MPAPRKYRKTRTFTFHVEEDNLEGVREICYLERKPSVGEKLNELMELEIERKRIMQPESNPIGIPFANGSLSLKQQSPGPTNKEILDKFATHELDKILPLIASMDLEVWKKYQRKTIDRMYSIRGRDKEKILEELRQKHQRKDVDKIVVTHEEHQPPQTQPEISIKENVH